MNSYLAEQLGKMMSSNGEAVEQSKHVPGWNEIAATKWIEQELSKAILGEEGMNNYSHEYSHNHWPPPNSQLEKFRLIAHIDGYSEFVLRQSAVQSVFGPPTLELLLLPRNSMRGVLCVATCKCDFKWGIACDYSMFGSVASAIPLASAFLRNLQEQHENRDRVKLPDDCEWINLDGLCVRDSRSGTVYPVPTDARRADILDAGVKEFRRTHPEK